MPNVPADDARPTDDADPDPSTSEEILEILDRMDAELAELKRLLGGDR